MRKLTAKEKSAIEKHEGVLKTTASHIVFKPDFKLKCIKLYEEGLVPRQIFESLGFSFNFLSETFFGDNMKRWKKLYSSKKETAFKEESRGRSKGGGRPKKLSIDDLSNEELKHLILVQKEVITQLKKRKALAKKS